MRRRGFSKEQIDNVRKAYRIMFQSKLLTRAAVEKVRNDIPQTPEVVQFIDFITQSKRGICR